jgi:hypothetical protein
VLGRLLMRAKWPGWDCALRDDPPVSVPRRPIDWEMDSREQAARKAPAMYSLPWSVQKMTPGICVVMFPRANPRIRRETVSSTLSRYSTPSPVGIAARHSNQRTTMRYDRASQPARTWIATELHPRRPHGLRHLTGPASVSLAHAPGDTGIADMRTPAYVERGRLFFWKPVIMVRLSRARRRSRGGPGPQVPADWMRMYLKAACALR